MPQQQDGQEVPESEKTLNCSAELDIALIKRDKAELVRHIGRLEDNLKWYVDERNRLLAAGEARPDLAKFLTDYAEKQFRNWSAQVGDYPDRKSCMEFWRQFKHYIEMGAESYADWKLSQPTLAQILTEHKYRQYYLRGGCACGWVTVPSDPSTAYSLWVDHICGMRTRQSNSGMEVRK